MYCVVCIMFGIVTKNYMKDLAQIHIWVDSPELREH